MCSIDQRLSMFYFGLVSFLNSKHNKRGICLQKLFSYAEDI